MAAQKKQRPLIRYAGSAAETSIGSKPIGSELENGFYSGRRLCQVWSHLGSGTWLLDIRGDITETRAVEPRRYTRPTQKNQMVVSTCSENTWAITPHALVQHMPYPSNLSQTHALKRQSNTKSAAQSNGGQYA